MHIDLLTKNVESSRHSPIQWAFGVFLYELTWENHLVLGWVHVLSTMFIQQGHSNAIPGAWVFLFDSMLFSSECNLKVQFKLAIPFFIHDLHFFIKNSTELFMDLNGKRSYRPTWLDKMHHLALALYVMLAPYSLFPLLSLYISQKWQFKIIVE